MTDTTSEVVARLTTDAEFLARKRGSYSTIGKDCAEAAALISSLVAENERLQHEVDSAGALRLRMEAHKSARAAAERLLAEARGALKPFAEAAESLEDNHADGSPIWETPAAMGIDARHLRRAKEICDAQ